MCYSESRKRKSDNQPTSFHHTYVMKLFDRSVDLARFQEDTPLYPICRAWMANQPRNPQTIIKYVYVFWYNYYVVYTHKNLTRQGKN